MQADRYNKASLIEEELLLLPGVVGISYNPRITIFVESEEYVDAVPHVVAKIPVEVKVIGRVYILGYGASIDRTKRVRPLVGGISVGNPQITAGTLAVVIEQERDVFALSNAHVFAMKIEDHCVKFLDMREPVPIIQPGRVDGGTLNDKIGVLHTYWPIEFNNPKAKNYLDAAVALLDAGVSYYNRGILTNGTITEIDITPVDVNNGDIIAKSGRTTGYTQGAVICSSAVIKVGFCRDIWAVFRDCIIVENGKFCRPGDSGSVCIKDGKFVGLLFAGSPVVGVICKAKYMIAQQPPPPPPPSPAGAYALLGALGAISSEYILRLLTEKIKERMKRLKE